MSDREFAFIAPKFTTRGGITMIKLDFLDHLDWEHAQTLGPASFVPLRGIVGAPPEYLLLKEALATGEFTISEVSEFGDVPNLLATNRLDLPVLIIEGEELLGGKQNRIVNTTVMVAANTKVTLPVSCVEQGRWHHESLTHKYSGRVIDRTIRYEKLARMARNPRARREHRADQGLVWELVQERLEAENLVSQTEAAYEIYKKRRKELIDWKSELRIYDDQCGFALINGGALIGAELHVPARKFKVQFDALVYSYLIELLKLPQRGKPSASNSRELRAMLGEPLEESFVQGVSLGKNAYVAWKDYIGHGLLVDDQLIQFSIISGTVSSQRARRHQ
jgi:hypothetical protein